MKLADYKRTLEYGNRKDIKCRQPCRMCIADRNMERMRYRLDEQCKFVTQRAMVKLRFAF